MPRAPSLPPEPAERIGRGPGTDDRCQRVADVAEPLSLYYANGQVDARDDRQRDCQPKANGSQGEAWAAADPQVLDRPLAHEQLEAGGEWDPEQQIYIPAHVEELAGHNPDADASEGLDPPPNKT